MPKRKPVPPREELLDCREEGLRLEDISEIYDVSVPTIKRWLSMYGLSRSRSETKEPKTFKIDRSQFDNKLDHAKAILGGRWGEERIRGYKLDGRFVKADDLIAAAGL